MPGFHTQLTPAADWMKGLERQGGRADARGDGRRGAAGLRLGAQIRGGTSSVCLHLHSNWGLSGSIPLQAATVQSRQVVVRLQQGVELPAAAAHLKGCGSAVLRDIGFRCGPVWCSRRVAASCHVDYIL